MVNHFASLLINLNLTATQPVQGNFVLADETIGGDFGITTEDGYNIALGDTYSAITTTKLTSPFIDRNYSQITLPSELQRVYDVLFPATASNYYKQFLLYSYLRVLAATDKAQDVKNYDKRITYNLNELTEYFRFDRLSTAQSSNADFNLLLSGNLHVGEDAAYFNEQFVVLQLGNSQYLRVFSLTQAKYFKQRQVPSVNPTGKDILLELSTSPNVSKPIPVGDTGLTFSITGPFNSAPNPLTTTNNVWHFIAEAPFLFDVVAKVNELASTNSLVSDMLDFNSDVCNISYKNLWHSHYNPVYKLSGLLLAYVERINILWQSSQT